MQRKTIKPGKMRSNEDPKQRDMPDNMKPAGEELNTYIDHEGNPKMVRRKEDKDGEKNEHTIIYDGEGKEFNIEEERGN